MFCCTYDEKITERVMSGILIQFIRRINRGSVAQCAINERDVVLFPLESINRTGIDVKIDPAVRPYIAVLMVGSDTSWSIEKR